MSEYSGEPSRWQNFVGFLGLLVIAAVFLAPKLPWGASHTVDGIVESAGPLNFGKYSGGGVREVATVRLSNGQIVTTGVSSGGPLSPGDHVAVLEQPHLVGPSAFVVVAKTRGQ
jgi:hypothetical protein